MSSLKKSRVIPVSTLLIVMASLLFFSSCHTLNIKKNPDKITQLELQEEIQRYYTRFTERVANSFLKLENTISPGEKLVLRRQYLLYDSEALKIATGPYPELNLLDMLVFIKLNRMVVESYWVPQVLKAKGSEFGNTFAESERDIHRVALKVLNREQLRSLDEFVRKWKSKNLDLKRVEKIRMGDFEKLALDIRTPRRSDGFSLTNFIVDVKSTVKAVDQALLAANRALFLAQQMPFLLRLHARIGSVEIAKDLIEIGPEADPLLQNVDSVLKELTILTREANQLLANYQKTFPPKDKMNRGIQAQEEGFLSQIETILNTSYDILHMMTEKKIDPDVVNKIENKFWNSIFTILALVIVTAFIIVLFWWGGYYLVKRQLKAKPEV